MQEKWTDFVKNNFSALDHLYKNNHSKNKNDQVGTWSFSLYYFRSN